MIGAQSAICIDGSSLKAKHLVKQIDCDYKSPKGLRAKSKADCSRHLDRRLAQSHTPRKHVCRTAFLLLKQRRVCSVDDRSSRCRGVGALTYGSERWWKMLCIIAATLNVIRNLIGSQWSYCRAGILWDCCRVLLWYRYTACLLLFTFIPFQLNFVDHVVCKITTELIMTRSFIRIKKHLAKSGSRPPPAKASSDNNMIKSKNCSCSGNSWRKLKFEAMSTNLD